MFFRRRKPVLDDTSEVDSESIRVPAVSTAAETAHLFGPGCLKIAGGLLRWEPVSGRHVILHPTRIARILMYGVSDVTGTALRLLWRTGIHVIFLTPQGHQILGRVQPMGTAPHLSWLQHRCVLDQEFRLSFCKSIVVGKIDAACSLARYFQQQGKLKDCGDSVRYLKRLQTSGNSARSLESLRGTEGTAARNWFELLGKVLPEGWTFPGRRARPATDPVNALLSLGYSLLVTRCQVLLAASDLDPLVGFLHDVRPGRPSLACDLMESFRVSLVDRLVLHLISTRQVSLDAFHQTAEGTRLQPEAFRKFLNAFEAELNTGRNQKPLNQIQAVIDAWIRQFREHIGTRE